MRRRALAFVGILLIGAALRLWDLDHESYWLDELSAVTVARAPWPNVFVHLAEKDVHPPLYFVLLKLWIGSFGDGEASTRALSTLVGLTAIVFAALLAAELARDRDAATRRRSALIAAALVAASPFLVYYAREARGYSLLGALSLASTFALARAAPRFTARRLVPYGVAGALLLYTHVFAVFTLAAHALYVLVAVQTSDAPAAERRRALLRAGLALLAVVALYLPWLPATIAQTRRVGAGFWIARPAPYAWLRAWLAEGPLAVLWVVALVALAALALRRAGRAGAVLLGGGLLAPTLLPIVVSYLRQPIFMAKYAIGASALLLVAAALPLALAPRRAWVAAAVLAAVGGAEAIRDVHLWRHKEQWRELAAFASAQSVDRGIPLVLTVHYKDFLRYYLDPRAVLWPVGLYELTTHKREGLAQRLEAAGRDRFWLLNVHPDRTDPALEPHFRARWIPTERHAWHMAEAILWVDARRVSGHTFP